MLGSQGMLGHDLVTTLSKEHTVTAWTRSDLDTTRESDVTEKITALHPDIIINATAYTNVDQAESEEAQATLVNGTAVGYLAHVAQMLDIPLVHYSTDYVFDGLQAEGYTEDDTTNPINAYGRSKLAGEEAIVNTNTLSYYIIRTSWLYGHHGKNFVETMLSLAEKGEPLKVVDDQIGSPTYTKDLAEATLAIINTSKPFGIYHITNSGYTSWYAFAKAIFDVYGKTVDIQPCTTADFPRPAKRPAFSVLQSTKLEPLRSWEDALLAYHTESS